MPIYSIYIGFGPGPKQEKKTEKVQKVKNTKED